VAQSCVLFFFFVSSLRAHKARRDNTQPSGTLCRSAREYSMVRTCHPTHKQAEVPSRTPGEPVQSQSFPCLISIVHISHRTVRPPRYYTQPAIPRRSPETLLTTDVGVCRRPDTPRFQSEITGRVPADRTTTALSSSASRHFAYSARGIVGRGGLCFLFCGIILAYAHSLLVFVSLLRLHAGCRVCEGEWLVLSILILLCS